jgi:hypothetical protein
MAMRLIWISRPTAASTAASSQHACQHAIAGMTCNPATSDAPRTCCCQVVEGRYPNPKTLALSVVSW